MLSEGLRHVVMHIMEVMWLGAVSLHVGSNTDKLGCPLLNSRGFERCGLVHSLRCDNYVYADGVAGAINIRNKIKRLL